MTFRILEKEFEDRIEFYPEWYCDVESASNYGWNSVHDKNLYTIPTKTLGQALERITWFYSLFKVQIKTYSVVAN